MRIFYASDTTPNADFQSNLWRNNLYLPLVELGHEVVEFDYDYGETFSHLDPAVPTHAAFIKTNRPILTENLLRQVRAAHSRKPLDLFFSYFYDACVLPEAIDEIRAMGIITINWYCNGSYQLHLVSEISPHYNWCLVPEKFRLKDYVSMGARPIYCQEAVNPSIYKPYDLPQQYDVTFVGQAYGDRPAYIGYLRGQGLDVRVWGVGWQQFSKSMYLARTPSRAKRLKYALRRWRHKNSYNPFSRTPIVLPDYAIGGVLTDEEMVMMYSRSKINIGFSSCGDTHKSTERILQVRLRDFEVPMSGGFYMVEEMDELRDFFEIGKEIVCYSSAEDLADKIKYYLAHDNEREAIRKAGRERCLRDHTWHKRFKSVFKEIGIGEQSGDS
jgi:spore maturation protein CgeB